MSRYDESKKADYAFVAIAPIVNCKSVANGSLAAFARGGSAVNTPQRIVDWLVVSTVASATQSKN